MMSRCNDEEEIIHLVTTRITYSINSVAWTDANFLNLNYAKRLEFWSF